MVKFGIDRPSIESQSKEADSNPVTVKSVFFPQKDFKFFKFNYNYCKCCKIVNNCKFLNLSFCIIFVLTKI